MKTAIISATLLIFALKSSSQTTTPAISKDSYLKKSKTQKTVAWLMLGGGVAITTVGVIISANELSNDLDNILSRDNSDNKHLGVDILKAGVGTALASIPFFISASKNKRRAASISFGNQKILFPQQSSIILKNLPALSLRIGL